MDAMEAFPTISRPVNTNCCPGSSFTLPSSNTPVRISGPLVSNNNATGLPHLERIFFTRSIRTFCSSWLPWEKLNLATFMPDSIIFSNISSLSVAGPMVHIIFVFLINFLLSPSVFSFFFYDNNRQNIRQPTTGKDTAKLFFYEYLRLFLPILLPNKD